MKKLLEEGRRKRGIEGDAEIEVSDGKKSKKRKQGEGEEGKAELSSLVEKLKKKAKR